MVEYRLYRLDNGQFVGRDVITAPDDARAAAEADRLRRGSAGELWCGPRRVRVFGAS
jgi:hypothetical protein